MQGNNVDVKISYSITKESNGEQRFFLSAFAYYSEPISIEDADRIKEDVDKVIKEHLVKRIFGLPIK